MVFEIDLAVYLIYEIGFFGAMRHSCHCDFIEFMLPFVFFLVIADENFSLL